MGSKAFPSLPKDTERVAKVTFHIETLYMKLGDSLDELLNGINPGDLDTASNRQPDFLARLALVTFFQYAEDLPDRLAVEAVRSRMDWKYALHLALNHPTVNPLELCEFRQRLIENQAGLQTLDLLLARLTQTSLLAGRKRFGVHSTHVLQAVCSLSRLDKAVEEMRAALESLAAFRPEWLRAIILPYWYDRYSNINASLPVYGLKGTPEGLARTIGEDMRFLLQAIAGSGDPEISGLPEVQAVRHIYENQYELIEGELRWKPRSCDLCLSSKGVH